VQPRPLERRVYGYYGSTGQGKTQALKAKLRQIRSQVAPGKRIGILALDPMEQLKEWDGSTEHDDCSDVEFVAHSRREVLQYLNGIQPDESFSLAYVPPVDSHEPSELNFLAGVAWALGNVWLVIDEAHASCNHAAVQAGEIPNMVACVKRGRHRRINLIIAAQRPVDVSTLIRAETLADTTVYFRLVRHDDLRDVAAERGPEFARRVSSLPRLTCLVVTADSIRSYRIIFDARGRPWLVSVGKTADLGIRAADRHEEAVAKYGQCPGCAYCAQNVHTE